MKKIVTQIYELQNVADANKMLGLGVDRIGSVILSQEEWKIPEIRDIGALVRKVGAEHSLIPLFSNEDAVLRVIDYYHPHFIHFCDSLVSPRGELPPLDAPIALQESVKKRFPDIKIMRSVPIPVSGEKKLPTLEIAKTLEETCDCFLTDTWLGKEPVSGFIGITGKLCVWETARSLVESSRIPVILAGGLSPENVYEGIMAVRPFGVDSCTRTNMTDDNGEPIRFKKDFKRVDRFVKEVRRAQATLKGPDSEKE